MRAMDWRGLGHRIWLVAVAACPLGGRAAQSQSPPVCVDCFDVQGYSLDLSAGRDAEPPAAILFSGWRNGRCQNDVVCTGTSDLFLGDVRWGDVQWSVDCEADDQEIIAFAVGHEPVDATPKLAPGQSGKLSTTITPVTFAGPLPVKVKIWVVPNPSPSSGTPADAEAEAKARALAVTAETGDIVTPQRVFLKSGTGIDLQFSSDVFPSAGFNAINDLYSSASCNLLTDLTSRGSVGYDAAQLNVYYVDGLQGNRAGVTCHGGGPGGSGQNVIFVAAERNYSPMQLAHELGHAMGLLHSGPLPAGGTAEVGDVDEMLLDPWLATDNLMRSGSDEVRQVTLGQIYRMHYDKLSWKWSQPGAPAGANSYPRTCQNSPVKGGRCPPLTLDPVGDWP